MTDEQPKPAAGFIAARLDEVSTIQGLLAALAAAFHYVPGITPQVQEYGMVAAIVLFAVMGIFFPDKFSSIGKK
jgi:hypothetical protein